MKKFNEFSSVNEWFETDNIRDVKHHLNTLDPIIFSHENMEGKNLTELLSEGVKYNFNLIEETMDELNNTLNLINPNERNKKIYLGRMLEKSFRFKSDLTDFYYHLTGNLYND